MTDTEARVIDIGITGNNNNIAAIPTQFIHFCQDIGKNGAGP